MSKYLNTGVLCGDFRRIWHKYVQVVDNIFRAMGFSIYTTTYETAIKIKIVFHNYLKVAKIICLTWKSDSDMPNVLKVIHFEVPYFSLKKNHWKFKFNWKCLLSYERISLGTYFWNINSLNYSPQLSMTRLSNSTRNWRITRVMSCSKARFEKKLCA